MKLLVVKHDVRRPLGKPKCRCEIGWEGVKGKAVS
jgi:hypothetical protein